MYKTISLFLLISFTFTQGAKASESTNEQDSFSVPSDENVAPAKPKPSSQGAKASDQTLGASGSKPASSVARPLSNSAKTAIVTGTAIATTGSVFIGAILYFSVVKDPPLFVGTMAAVAATSLIAPMVTAGLAGMAFGLSPFNVAFSTLKGSLIGCSRRDRRYYCRPSLHFCNRRQLCTFSGVL